MIEAYSFLAAFPFQVLAMSLLLPTWFIRYVRVQFDRIPVERLQHLNPSIDHSQVLGRYLNRYRSINIVIALLGIPLMIWLFSYFQGKHWSDGPVEALVGVYFMLQALPFAYVISIGAKHGDVIKHLSMAKRSAPLERRRLFDFVSPIWVALAILCYVLFAAYVVYIAQDPFPGFAAYATLGIITLVYVVNALCVYWQLYGRKLNPFEPHASRTRMIGLGVKASVYSCIAIVAFLSLNFTLVRLDLQRWEPFALSIFLGITALLCAFSFAPPRLSEANRLASIGHL